MTSMMFEELDYRPSPIGTLSLRRRRLSRDGEDIFEIKLDDGYLMSSQFTAGEIALAERALERFGERPIDVVIGGLGLGYTAKAALDTANIRRLLIVEMIPEVVEWHQRHLVPLGEGLTQRAEFIVGDFFDMAVGEGFEGERSCARYDAILVDIDNSPQDLLDAGNAHFYSVAGLSAAADKLNDEGVFALWSTDRPDADFTSRLEAVFDEVKAELVEFDNPYRDTRAFNTIYQGTRRSRSSQ